MARVITGWEKVGFFIDALKENAMSYGLAIVFLCTHGGVGGAILYFGTDLDFLQLFAGYVFLVAGVGTFLLIFYLNISSMAYYYENAIMKKYGRYRRATVTEITHETDETDGVIRCFITVRHAGEELADLFELSLEKAHLLEQLLVMKDIPVRIVDDMPALLRIAPRKLHRELELQTRD